MNINKKNVTTILIAGFASIALAIAAVPSLTTYVGRGSSQTTEPQLIAQRYPLRARTPDFFARSKTVPTSPAQYRNPTWR